MLRIQANHWTLSVQGRAAMSGDSRSRSKASPWTGASRWIRPRPPGVAARITEAVRSEMARGIWDVRIDIAPEAGLPDGTNVIRFTGSDGNGALFAVDPAAGLSSLTFARGSMGFLPRGVSTRLFATKLDITFLSPQRPIPADPGMILTWDRGTWRRPDFELYAWDRFPRVLIFDTATYDVQDGLFNRLAFFVEKAGYRDTIEDPSALEGKHGYNAHDYRAEDLARFFTAAAQKGISLTPGETELEQILEENDLIRRTATGFAPGDGAVISISRSSSTILRRLLLSHESAHGEFFTLPGIPRGGGSGLGGPFARGKGCLAGFPLIKGL